jgi:hypothetical protein
MENFLESLKYMAEHGGRWFGYKEDNKEWELALENDDLHHFMGFTQSDVKEFLEHYKSTITNQKLPCKENDIVSFFGTWPGSETDEELLKMLKDLD